MHTIPGHTFQGIVIMISRPLKSFLRRFCINVRTCFFAHMKASFKSVNIQCISRYRIAYIQRDIQND